MSHINELSDASLLLHNRIVAAITSNNLAADPGSIVRSLCEAVLRLAAQGQMDKIKNMLEIIIAYREHITYTDALFGVVELALERHTSLSLSILKSCMKSGGEVDRQKFAGLLLANAALPGVKYVLARYFGISKEEAARAKPEDGGRQSLPPVQDAEEFLCALSTMTPGKEDVNEFIYGFLGGAAHLEAGVLHRIIEAMSRAHRRNLENLSYIFTLYRKIVNRNAIDRRAGREAGPAAPLITPKLVELTRHEVVEASHPEGKIEAFVALFSDMLLPSFIPLIAAVNGIFIAENRYAGLLRNMVKYIGVEEFMEIVKPLQIEKHHNVLRTVSNCDLETFVALYGLYDSEAKATSRNYLVLCLPGFCNYCTDHGSNIGEVLRIIKAHLRTHRNMACQALEQLVHSHTLNLQSTLILDNPIPRDMSTRILEEVGRSGAIDDLISVFMQTNNNECDRALEMMIRLTGRDLSGELAQIIKSPESNPRMALYDALKLMAFFAHRWAYDYDLVHELLRLRSSAESNIQKRAYFLLYALCSAHSMPCFCDLLFTDAGMHPSSTRNRLMLLHAIVRRGCNGCKCENMVERFFSELVKYSKEGNAKARKFTKEIIVQLAGSAEFRSYLLLSMNRETEDQGFIAGCLAAASMMLEQIGGDYERYSAEGGAPRSNAGGIDAATNGFIGALLARVSQISFASEAFVGEIIQVYTLVFSLRAYAAFADDAVFVVSKYIGRYHKKYNRELRDCCLAAQKNNHPLSKDMSLHLKFKNRAGAPKEIQVLKNRHN